MLKVLDFTEMVVSPGVMQKIREELEKQENKVVDFAGAVILEYVHEIIAESIIKDGLVPINIADSCDRDKIDYYRRKMLQPQVDGLGEFIRVFKKRFKVGDVCVMDKTLYKGLKTNESRRSIVMIEGYNDKKKSVKIRVYYSGMAQPKYFRENGGYNSEKLFYRAEVNMLDLYNDEILIEYPRDDLECRVIDILFQRQKK